MGFFPNLFKGSPTKIITDIVLPPLFIGRESIKAVTPLVKEGVRSIQSLRAGFQQAPGAQPRQSIVPYQMPYQQFSPYGVQPAAQFYGGGQPWDSSIYSTPQQAAPYWTSDSMPLDSGATTASWEDYLVRF